MQGKMSKNMRRRVVLRISCAVSQSNAHLSAAVMVFQTMEHGMKRHQAAPDVLLY